MRAPQYRQLACELQERTTGLLLRQLRPADYSRRCTSLVLLSCLVLAAARQLSLAAVAAVRRACPSRETLRQALYATLPDYDALRRRLPALLRASLPRHLTRHRGRRRYPMAIDLHRVPYYKRGRTPPEHVRKGQRLAGTRYAHDYATASLLRKGQYYVVAVTPYDPGESLADITRRLLRQAAALGFSPRYVLMDRSFWSADVFRYLQRARYPFLIPVQARGKLATAPGGPTGTQAFFHRCPSGRYTYRVANRQKQTAVVTILVQRRNHGGRGGKQGRYAWVYALWRVDSSSAQAARESYRRRFRIESSYRLLETGRGRTSSRDEGLRLWYVVLAVLLVNHWLQLRHEASHRWGSGEAGCCHNLELLVVLAQILLETPAVPEAAEPGEAAVPQGAPPA
jgi:putative transposase